MKVEEVLRAELSAPAGTRLPHDCEIITSCPKCGEQQTLGDAKIDNLESETIYTCKNGCQPIIIIGLPGETSWEGRGYRMGSQVIRNIADIYIPLIGSEGGIKIPGSPDALKKH